MGTLSAAVSAVMMRHSLIPQYREMHDAKHFGGRSIYGHATEITSLVLGSGAKSLLDYGSGKGRQYIEGRIHMLWGGIMPTLYDPAVAGLDKKPAGQFDGVICTDVLEHVPEDELAETLADIRSYARMWAFFSVCCEPAKKTLPDGRNVHVTVRSQDWWLDQLTHAFDSGPTAHVQFERTTRTKPATARKCKSKYKEYGWT